jgi:hypothetical protein
MSLTIWLEALTAAILLLVVATRLVHLFRRVPTS